MRQSATREVSLRLLRNPVHCLALGFGSGLSPVAPGTIGTLIGMALYLPLSILPLLWYVTIVAISFLLGIGICHYTGQYLGVHDHRGIVWDEIVGYWVAMSIVTEVTWQSIVLGFVVFRFAGYHQTLANLLGGSECRWWLWSHAG